MNFFLRFIAIFLASCCCLTVTYSQSTTNSGTEFYTGYMLHNNGASPDGNGADGSLMSLYITSAINTSGTISIADGSFAPIPFTVGAGQVTVVTIPPAAFLSGSGVFSKGVHIVSLKPVAIYAHIYAQAVSGATLLLPVSTLGRDYYSINYNQQSNAKHNNPSYSVFVIIATEDNTTVNITPSNDLIDGHPAGSTFKINLKKGQLYQGLSSVDLSGSKITSVNSATGGCTKIAVFSGSSRIDIGCNQNHISSDNLFQQVYPTASWGKTYITVPLASRNYDVYRVVLSDPSVNPNVTVNGVVVPFGSFTKGFYEFASQQPNTVTAEQPIQVVQYAVTEQNTIDCKTDAGDVGDPEMIYLNPLEQTLSTVTLYSTGNYKILNSFINVTIKTSAVNTFMLDGDLYNLFTPVPGNPAYAYAQIPVLSGIQNTQAASGGQGTHLLSAADGFNAIAYGFGKEESYGYAAGTNLQNLNEHITLASVVNDTVTQNNGCTGSVYKLQLVLPYKTTNIMWDFKNGTTYTDSNPTPVSMQVKGTQTLYKYEYYKPVTYTKGGDTAVIATVFNPLNGACGNNDIVEFDFNISAPPIAAFTSANTCFGDSTMFTDKTNVNGGAIKTWQWDFGDNSTSALQNPVHLYAKGGNYNVSLTATNTGDCATNIVQAIHINQKPVAAFTISAPDCAGQNILFTDKSATTDGKIIQWVWSYGDGKTDTLTNNKPFNHTYASTGTDTVKLTVVTDGGCSSTVNKQVIIINPIPVVDFSLPAVCLSDSYAQFTDRSLLPDNPEAPLTYLWNFGDQNANAANPNTATEQNPKHKYTVAANYNVSLTVTSASGCTFTKTQPFTVNGSVPVAAFTVENANNLCSADPIVFDNQSTVNFGSITKIKWYFDYVNHPQDTVTFNRDSIPVKGKFYHNYGVFNAPVSKSYTVRMDVYSGITCVNITQQSITVNANPFVTLLPIGPVCTAALPIQIIENINGFTGKGTFTGTGISSGGLFNPAISGPGSFVIKYNFTATNGCVYDTTEKINVYANPKISVPPDVFLLQGGQVTIPAKASGDSLTYKWTPAVGLDHDDVLNPTATSAENTTYMLLVTNGGGCTAAAEVNVVVLKTPAVPNAFTPNNDGINDTWDIKYLDSYPNCLIEIFNRYGAKVYSSIGYPIPWDGRYNGNELPVGTYYYIINPKNGRKSISGSVTIIR